LSDYLFTLARKIGNESKVPENQWIPRVWIGVKSHHIFRV
jgi:hypothetical protein